MPVVAGLGLGIVDVLLAQQALGRLERDHERVLPGQLTEVQAFAEPDTGQLRTVHGDGEGTVAGSDSLTARTS
jgi:hypothetical protein